jgi:hypothetical protein
MKDRSTERLREPSAPLSEEEWEVWYRDTFDRECPPSIDVRGRGLASGLLELWARYLFETVRPGGTQGFSRFHLRWGQAGFVNIQGSWEGAIRLRAWVFGESKHTSKGYVKEGDVRLLTRVAIVHARLIQANRSEEKILDVAAQARDRADFEKRLASLEANLREWED